MNPDVQTLLKPLNLTRHNRKVLEDFSGVMGLVASVSAELREPLIDELMISAICGKNMPFIELVDSLSDFNNPERIEYILTASLVNIRNHKQGVPSSDYISDMWDKLSTQTQHEIAACLFTTTVSNTGDKDIDLKNACLSLNTLSMLNKGDVDLFVNTILSAHLTNDIYKSNSHSMDFMRSLNEFTLNPIYDHDVISGLEKRKFILKSYEQSLDFFLNTLRLEGNLSKMSSILTAHLSTNQAFVSNYILTNAGVNWLSGHSHDLLKQILHGDWLNINFTDQAKELLNYFLEHPKLDKTLSINPQLLNITGSEASNYSAIKLHAKGILPKVKYSKFGEDESVFFLITSKNEAASTDTKKIFSSIAMNMPSIKKFAQAFDLIKSKGGYLLPDVDHATKIAIVAALNYYENNASKNIPRDQRPAELSLKEMSPSTTDPFFMISGISRWIAEDLPQDIIYNIKPNDSQYLKDMMQLGFLDQSYIDKLNPKHRREVLDQDMGL